MTQVISYKISKMRPKLIYYYVNTIGTYSEYNWTGNCPQMRTVGYNGLKLLNSTP